MKYTLHGFDQQGMMSFGMDLVDAAILRFMVDFHATGRMVVKMNEYGEVFYWLKHSHVMRELPMLGITSRQGMLYRMKKLQAAGLVELYTKRDRDGSFSCFRFTHRLSGIMYSSDDEHTKKMYEERWKSDQTHDKPVCPSMTNQFVAPMTNQLVGKDNSTTTNTSTKGKGDSYSPPAEDTEKTFLEKPSLKECMPEDLETAAVAAASSPAKKRVDKCVELESRFPVVELMNTILEDEVTDPRDLVPLWNRIRKGSAAYALTPENLFDYAMFTSLGGFKMPFDLKGFLEEHDSDPCVLQDARSNGAGMLMFLLKERHEAEPFRYPEEMVEYARTTFGKYAAGNVNPGWHGVFTEKQRIKEAKERR